MTFDTLSPTAGAAPLGWLLVALVGASLGSFANVVIHRLPRGISLVWRRSRCPGCEQPIAWFDNVPLLSFALLWGRCRRCRARIPARYPLVEALGALLALAAVWRAPGPAQAVLWTGFALALLVVIFIDYDHRIIPDAITLPGAGVGLAAALLGPRPLPDALWGVALGAGGLLLVAWLYRLAAKREGLGLGDVKLMAMIGAFCGWQGALVTILLGSLAGSLVGIALLSSGRGTRRTALPFGSFLAPAAWAALFAGDWLWGQYLRLFSG